MKIPISGGKYNTSLPSPGEEHRFSAAPDGGPSGRVLAKASANAREALPRGSVRRSPGRAIAPPCSSRVVLLTSPGTVDGSQSWRKRDRDQTRVRATIGKLASWKR